MLEPKTIAMLQLGSFLVMALSWQLPTPSLGADIKLSPPVVGSVVVNQYRQSESEYSSGHRGVDYGVSLGQGVFAPADGTVHFVGTVVNRELISLAHDGNLLSAFEPVCSELQKGEQVLRGELIGEICEGDSSYTPHCEGQSCLHVSIRKNGEYLSPLWFLGELKASRLLPWVEPESLAG